MHELSIVSSVLDQLDEWKKQHGGRQISKVGLRVGELAGVDVDCLRFGFECVVKETEWASLALEIEQVARRQRCPRCSHEFKADNWARICRCRLRPVRSAARSATITIAGEELQIAYVEVEDE